MKDMMKKCGEIINKLCQADDFTFQIGHSHNLYTRFAQNAITQHIEGKNLKGGSWAVTGGVTLQVAFENKTGSASVNQLDEDSLKMLVKKAEDIARLNKPDPEHVASEGKHSLRELVAPAAATTELKVEKVVDGIEKCIKNAVSKDAKVSGISEKHINERYMLTKNGFEGYDQGAYFSHSMTMKKGGIETKVYQAVSDYDTFSMEQLIDRLNSQFDSLQEPQPYQKGRIPVIMRPQAVLNWLHYLVWTLQQREADDGLNPFTGQNGKQFFGEKFTLRSVTSDPKIHAPLFMGNGLPTEDTDWILNGVIKQMQCDRYYAKQKGLKPASLFNIVVDGGDTNEQQMMQMVERGVILNDLWYIRSIDAKVGEWTGLTRDGVLFFEDGKIKNAVTNFRWNEVLHDVTKRILALGPAYQLLQNTVIPTMLIDDFNFVDVTTF